MLDLCEQWRTAMVENGGRHERASDSEEKRCGIFVDALDRVGQGAARLTC